MLVYLLSFSWGICILFSLVGWGGAINRVLLSKHQIDWGQRAAWGLAFSIFVGGVLNVTWNISRTTILLYLGLGILYWLIDLLIRTPKLINSKSHYISHYKNDKVLIIGVLIVCSLGILQYAGSVSTLQHIGRVSPANFNNHDDFQAYFVFPNKMLQTGSMGPDPFSARRIASSLGGQSFLHTFVLSMLSERNLHIIDPGLGLLIVIGILIGYCKERGISPRMGVFILLLFLLIPPPTVNITALVIALALFLSLFRTIEYKELSSYHFMARAFIIALITAALMSSKSSLIPASGILFLLSYAFYILRSRLQHKAISEFISASLMVVIFLLPWMISMYQSSGTFLFPLLGKGYHGSVYGNYPLPYSELTGMQSMKILLINMSNIPFFALCLFGIYNVWLQKWRVTGWEVSLSLLISVSLGTVITALTLVGSNVYRFTFPFMFAAIFVLMTEALKKTEVSINGAGQHIWVALVPALLAGMLIGSVWEDDRRMYLEYISSVKLGVRNVALISDREIEQYTKMQQAIPEGETVLARLEKPFLLDFKRNTILIADSPGGASLPPGMPFYKGSEALAKYLTSKSIRYVAYSYASEAAFPKKLAKRRSRPEEFPINRIAAQNILVFQENLEELGKTKKHIYDDKEIFVIDLSNRKM